MLKLTAGLTFGNMLELCETHLLYSGNGAFGELHCKPVSTARPQLLDLTEIHSSRHIFRDHNIPQMYLETSTVLTAEQVSVVSTMPAGVELSDAAIKIEPNQTHIQLSLFDDSYADLIKVEKDIKTETETASIKQETVIGSMTYEEKQALLKVCDTSSLHDHSPTCQLRITLEGTRMAKENNKILQCCEQLQVATGSTDTVSVATNPSSTLPVATNTSRPGVPTEQILPLSEKSGLNVATNVENSPLSDISISRPVEITPLENYDDPDSTSSSGTIVLDIPPSTLDNVTYENESNMPDVGAAQESTMIPEVPLATSLISHNLPVATNTFQSPTVVDNLLLLPDGSGYDMDKLLSVTSHMLTLLEKDLSLDTPLDAKSIINRAVFPEPEIQPSTAQSDIANTNNTDEDIKTQQTTTEYYDIVMPEGDDIISVSHTDIVNHKWTVKARLLSQSNIKFIQDSLKPPVVIQPLSNCPYPSYEGLDHEPDKSSSELTVEESFRPMRKPSKNRQRAQKIISKTKAVPVNKVSNTVHEKTDQRKDDDGWNPSDNEPLSKGSTVK